MSQQHEIVSQMSKFVNLSARNFFIDAQVCAWHAQRCVGSKKSAGGLRLIGSAGRDEEAEQVDDDTDANVRQSAINDGARHGAC